jgi:DNA-binding transcriptional LysR family regulator
VRASSSRVSRRRSLRALRRGKWGWSCPIFFAALAAAQSNLILTTPSRLARKLEKSADVRVVKAPRELVGFKYQMIWHARLTADPAHEWFRNQVESSSRKGAGIVRAGVPLELALPKR